MDWEEYVRLIQSKALNPDDIVWKIPTRVGMVYYRNFRNEEGWLNGCEYIVEETYRLVKPICKTLSNPISFYNEYLVEPEEKLGFARFSKKQLNKLKPKPKKFCSVDMTDFYVDSDGCFYEYQRTGSAKKELEEWNRFHDNNDAVLANIYNHGLHNEKIYLWFDNMIELKKYMKELCDNQPSWAAEPYYTIVRIGYKKLHPDERINYIRIPYYPVDKLLDSHTPVCQIVKGWKQELKGIYFYNRIFDNCNWDNMMEEMLGKYIKYREKKDRGK